MKKILTIILTVVTLMVIGYFLLIHLAFGGLEGFEAEHSTYAKNFVLLEDSVSPDSSLIYYHYVFDQGGFGYSRSFWAVTGMEGRNENIANQIIPDGYKILGWTEGNELVLEKFNPSYYIDKAVELRTGMEFKEVRLIITE